MRSLPSLVAGAVALASLTVVGATSAPAHAAPAFTAYALSGSSLLGFDLAKPSVVTTTAITGVDAGETLVGIDVRPQNGELYALGVNASANTATIYDLHEQTGLAVPVGTTGSVAFTTDGTTPVDLPDPAVVGYGVDVNPAADRLRVVAGALTFRVNPSTGLGVDGDNGGLAGSVTGVNPDGVVHGDTSSADGAAYTNDVANNGGVTTLYTLDAGSNGLFIQNPPNTGTQTQGQSVTLAGSPLDFTGVGGFDIAPGVNAASSNQAVTSGSAYAVLTVGGSTGLYAINLVNGAATALGTVGNGTLPVQGLALQRDASEGYPAIGLSADGLSLVRFSTSSPGTTTTQVVGTGSLGGGETLAALAWRPSTGQLLGLGVNGTTNAATLYLVDPQGGGLTRIGGAFGLLAWVDAGGATIDLPDPATTAYAVDVNPQVDRVRLTAGGGLNARANPGTGAPVDGDNASAGVQPDGAPGLAFTGLSYTHPYGGATSTTAYALAWATNQLATFTNPNAGAVGDLRTVTANGAALDFGPLGGVDVLESSPTTAYAVLSVGGQATLYRLDLATARATAVGSLLVQLRSLAVGQAGTARPVVTAPAPRPATLTRVAAPRQVHRVVDTGRVLSCPTAFTAARCTTTVRVVATYHAGKRTTKVVVGTATVRTARGKATRVKVALSRKGVRLLKQRRTLRAVVVLAAPTGPKGAVRTTKVPVTLRKKRL